MQLYQINKKRIVTEELLFVLYFWGFTLLRPLLQQFPNNSEVLLFIYVLILFSISIFRLIIHPKIFIRPYFLLIGIIFVILCDLLIRPNNYTIKYLYEFIIYGIIPVHMLSQVKNPRELLKLFSLTSFILFLIYFFDPLNNYYIFGDYMTYGFNLVLPAYYGIYIGRKFFNYRWMYPFELLSLASIVIFANRSALLSVFVFWVIMTLYKKRSQKKLIKVAFLLLFFLVFMFFLRDILSYSITLLNHYKFNSYSLVHLRSFLNTGDINKLFSGRLYIWQLASDMVKTNPIIGYGAGAFQAKYGFYSHNLYYDIMLHYGIVGLLVFITLIVNSSIYVYKQNGYVKLLGILFLCLWFPKLFLSTYLFKDIGIWCFLTFGLLSFRNMKDYSD